MFNVQKIHPEITYQLRHVILRPHQSIEASMFKIDHDDHTFHVGILREKKLISVASFIMHINPDFTAQKQYRLRQMATDESFRKMGAGKSIVNYAEHVIKERDTYFLWCKARTNVQKYYNRLGF